MIILISPAKNMDFNSPLPEWGTEETETFPLFQKNAEELVRSFLSGKTPEDLMSLMKISHDLAYKTCEFFKMFGKDKQETRPAVFAYAGTVFQNLDIASLGQDEIDFAQAHLRILSALYGYLSPSDRISPYRLDMKTPITPGEADSLTDYWKKTLTAALDTELKAMKKGFVLNLASSEFTRAFQIKTLSQPFITVDFKEERKGKLVTVGTYAKMARGNMVRQILIKKITRYEDLQALEIQGYRYEAELSRHDRWCFVK